MNQDNFKKNKSFLIRYRYSKKKLKRLEEKLIDLNERLISLQSPVISDMPRGHTPGLTLDDLLVRKEELEERIKHERDKGIQLRKEVDYAIDQLDDTKLCDILEEFFINDLTLEEIGEKYCYSVRHTIRLYSEAIRQLKIQ